MSTKNKPFTDILSGKDYISLHTAHEDTGYSIAGIKNQLTKHKGKIGYKNYNGIIVVTVKGKDTYTLRQRPNRRPCIFVYK